MARFGFKRISLRTRLNSRAKLTVTQLWRLALLDVYGSLPLGDSNLLGFAKVSITLDQEGAAADNKAKLDYIFQGKDMGSQLKWYYGLMIFKVPELIVTFVAYLLDRMTLMEFQDFSVPFGIAFRGQKIGWPTFLLRGFVNLVMSVPLFLVRCVCSPINTLYQPMKAFSHWLFNMGYYQEKNADYYKREGSDEPGFLVDLIADFIAMSPFIALLSVVVGIASVARSGVFLFSNAGLATLLGGVGATLSTPLLVMGGVMFALPLVGAFILQLVGMQMRPSDALYRQVDLSHKGYDEESVDTYETTEKAYLRRDKDGSTAALIAKFSAQTDSILDQVPRKYEASFEQNQEDDAWRTDYPLASYQEFFRMKKEEANAKKVGSVIRMHEDVLRHYAAKFHQSA